MNGFKLMADSYRTLVEQGKISQEDAEKEISTYEFLAACKQEDLYRFQPAPFQKLYCIIS